MKSTDHHLMLLNKSLGIRNVTRLLLLAVLSCTWGLAAEVPLVVDGRATAMVLLGKGIKSSDPAVTLLLSHVKQMSGVSLPWGDASEVSGVQVRNGRIEIDGEDGRAKAFVIVGESDVSAKLGVSLDGIGPGGIIVKTVSNALVLIGRGDQAGNARADGMNVHAVVNFLEALGCRSLWPGPIGKVIPKKTSILVSDLDIRFTPMVAQRRIRMMPRAQNRGTDFKDGLAWLGFTEADYSVQMEKCLEGDSLQAWGTWNGLGGDIGIQGGHSGNGLSATGGWKAHGSEHPEWFALQADGTRDQTLAGDRWRICESNRELRALVARDILKRLQGKPALPISLSPNDGGFSSFCMCTGCQQLDPPHAPKIQFRRYDKVGSPQHKVIEYPSLSDRHLNYWNDIANQVTAIVPEQLFIVDAYSIYSDPPVRERVHPNLIVRYVPNDTAAWEGWKSAGARRIYWRPNNLHGSYRDGYVRPTSRKTAENISFFANAGMLATDMQGIYNFWATQGLEYYIAARVTWDPARTFEDVLNDYCRSGFGAAAEYIRDYWLLVDQRIHMRIENRRGMFPRIEPGAIDQMRDVLEKASQATAGDPMARQRVAFLRAGFEFTAISAEAHKMKEEAEAGVPPDPAKVRAVMQRRWSTMRAIFQNYPLAVNVPVVASNDAPLNKALGWQGPELEGNSGLMESQTGDNWLYEDQSDLRSPSK